MSSCFIGSRGFGSSYGGVEHAVNSICIRAAKSGPVHVYTNLNDSSHVENLFVHRVPKMWSTHLAFTLYSVIHSIFVLRVRGVFIFAAGPCMFTPFYKLFGVRTICCLRGYDSKRKKWGFISRSMLRIGEYFAVHTSDSLVVNSKGLYSLYRDCKDKILFIPNGCEPISKSNLEPDFSKKFSLASSRYVLYGGRLDSDKNVDYLIEEFISANIPDICLVVAGSDNSKGEYTEYLKSMSDSRVFFLGHLNQTEYHELLLGSFVYVLPSSVEGMSNTLLAAAASGCALFCSDIDENRYVVASDACLYSLNVTGALSGKLRDLVNGRIDMEQSIEENRKYVMGKFSWDECALEFMSLVGD